ncbi:MAG: MerR family transcriptional regulator, partial [Clostridiales bacterium]
MRIGQLAKKYQIAHSSIYYYMKLGLLIPMAEDKFYEFDDQCQKDLETIIKFKEMNFSLEEISAILSLQRLSPLADPEYVDSINRLLGKKFYELHHEIKVLEQVIQQISAERARLITDARLTAVR